MRHLETVRNKKMDEYVLICQMLFLLLTGILLARVWDPLDLVSISSYKAIIMLLFPLVGFVLIRGMEKRWYAFTGKRTNAIINGVYLACTIPLLIYERESFFKFLLLMPVIVSALQYGTNSGYFWAFFSSLGMFIIAVGQRSRQIDVDIMITGVIWLFAWLFGRMSEAELEIRTELQRQAERDGLTGVFNHRSFHRILEELLARAPSENKSLTVIMLDVNFFKYYNDAYGHQKGDEALQQLAQLIASAVGDRGICARYGGDEFAILVWDCDANKGAEIGEEIREAVDNAVFEGASILPKGKITVSVGVATFPEHAKNKESLLQRADEALYKAKYKNSDKVEIYYSVFDEIGHSLQGKEKDLLNSMRTLLMVVNAKDRYTYGHSERVMHYAVEIGRRLALWEWEIQDLMAGALLHDIGKIEITREILNKANKLNIEEWNAIKQHPVWGADMIRPVSSLSGAVEIVLYHHENYDGSGYPAGLKGKEIPLGARIMRLADSFDAMTTHRPYKKALSMRDAMKDLKRLKGIYYDPEVVEAFIKYISETGVVFDVS